MTIKGFLTELIAALEGTPSGNPGSVDAVAGQVAATAIKTGLQLLVEKLA